MGPTVRSVDVRLNAMVAGYIRDINRAGDATVKSFDQIHASTSKAREEFIETERATDRLKTSTDNLASSARLASPSQRKLTSEVDRLSVAAVKGSSSIDRYSGRIRILAELLATIGPGLLPLGAGGLAALAGLAGLFGGATVGALGMVVAVQGVGDALKAVEKARLEPTVANLQAAEEAMSRIAPEAREFVARFQELRPVLKAIRDAGAAEFFPGLTDSLDSLEKLAPTLEKIVAVSGRAGGGAIARGADSLTTDRWAPFFEFLTDEIPDAIDDASRLVGSLAHGASEMWMAFDPTNDNFIDWLVDVGDGFDRWASSAQGREDIRGFLEYVEKTGPKVGDFFVAAAGALTDMAQAAAPLSGPVLDGLTAAAEVVSVIADSDLGTPILAGVAALTLYSRGLQAAVALQSKLTGSGAASRLQQQGVLGFSRGLAREAKAATPSMGQFGTVMTKAGQSSKYASDQTLAARSAVRSFSAQAARAAVPVGGLALATTGVAEGFGLTNTALGAMLGPWGAALGLIVDITTASKDWEDAQKRAQAAIDTHDIDAVNQSLAEYEDRLNRLNDLNNTSGVGDAFSDAWGLAPWNDGSLTKGLDEQVADVEDGMRRLQDAQKWTENRGVLGPGLDPAVAYAMADVAEKALIAADAVAEFRGEYEGLNALLSKQGSWDAYQAAIDGLNASIKENGRTLDSNTEKGRENRAQLNGIAEAALQYAETLTGADRIDFLKHARRAFVDGAEKAGGMDRRAKDILETLNKLIKTDVDVDVDVHTTAAERRLSAFLNRPRKISIQAQVDSFVDLVGVPGASSPRKKKKKKSSPSPAGVGSLFQADGGYISGPGGPRDDAIAAYLSNGEYVIQAEAVDRYGVGFFDRLNAMRFASGGPVGYAGGGPVRTMGSREADAVAGGLRGMSRELRAAEKAIAAERKQRESLVGRRDTLRSGVREGLSDDIWRPGNDWASGGPNAGLRSSIAEIRAFDQLTGRLKKKGVKGGALDAILAQGDLATAQSYAGMSKSELAEYQRLYNVQRRELNRVSGNAGDAAYGAAIKESVRQERLAVAEIKQLRAAVNRGTKSNRDEQAKNRAAARKGAGYAARRKSRGYLP